MTVKYLHVRAVDLDSNILPRDGVTVAYTIDEAQGAIYAAFAKCRPDELFCYKTGREQAAQRLQAPDGDFEVLELSHPVSDVLADWIATDVWPNGAESRDMGYAIDVYKDTRGRWISDFYPAQAMVNFSQEVPPHDDSYDQASFVCPV